MYELPTNIQTDRQSSLYLPTLIHTGAYDHVYQHLQASSYSECEVQTPHVYHLFQQKCLFIVSEHALSLKCLETMCLEYYIPPSLLPMQFDQ